MLNLSMYKPFDLETKINSIYQANGIYSISDLDINHIASIFNITIEEYIGPSCADWSIPNEPLILLNYKSSIPTKRTIFFHELSHIALHEGDQDEMPKLFRDYQERQAKIFQLYAAMPIYMFEELYNVSYSNSVSVLAEKFILPPELVKERLQQIYRRINNIQRDYWLREQVTRKYRKSDPSNWSKETKSLLDQLYAQIAKRKGVISNG